MATPKRTPKGWRYQFNDHNGARAFASWGDCSKRHAHTIAAHIDELVASKKAGFTPSPETRAWVTSAPDALVERLATVGLCAHRTTTRLAEFVNAFIDRRRSEVKVGTIKTDERARKHLLDYFDPQRDLRSITKPETADFRAYLLRPKPDGAGLAVNTANTTVRVCKQFFTAAIRQDLLSTNPFSGLPTSTKGNPANYRFIDRETIDAVLDACPCAQWRLIVVLARYGGLRCPSEVLALKWSDVLWDRNRFRIGSSKTEHHADGGIRYCPLFPEIARELQTVYDLAEPGEDRIITRYPEGTPNLATQLYRIIDSAGVPRWPKPWQNLRSTRHNELRMVDKYPSGIVNQWIGHDERTAQEFYEHATDADFDAASSVKLPTKPVAQVVAKSVASGRVTGHHGKRKTALRVSGAVIEDHQSPKKWARQDSNL